VLINAGATGNIIGGFKEGNNISSNTTGVDLEGNGTNSNSVETNVIGIDVVSNSLGNSIGVLIGSGATANVIGGTNASVANNISGNTNDGVDITGSGTTKNVVEGNTIGSGAAGNGSGVVIENGATGNLIGNTLPGASNDITSNGTGVLIQDVGTSNNTVESNHIGTDTTGTTALPNEVGVAILNGATSNFIGGVTTPARNLISGNSSYGIEIFGSGTYWNQVVGNSIGTNNAGTAALANDVGVLVSFGAIDNTIGGSSTAGNLISGNTSFGVEISQPWTSGNMVEGNLIGLNVSGTGAVANGYGVGLGNAASYNVIGFPGAANFISGNTNDGVIIDGSGTSFNTLQDNVIGLATDVITPLGNGEQGVLITNQASNNLIGGVIGGVANIIAFNGQNGVLIGKIPGNEDSQSAGSGNAVLANKIYGNAALGIDDNSISTPVLSSATLANGVLTINGSIDTNTNEDLRVEIFANPVNTPTGSAQGETFVGAFTAQTGGSNSINFTDNLTTSLVQPGQVITLTVTDQFGNTSELSLGAVIS